MDIDKIISLLTILVNNSDPKSGKELFTYHIQDNIEIIEALKCSIDILEDLKIKEVKKINPNNQIRSWTEDELINLRNDFSTGATFQDLSIKYRRTEHSIFRALVRVGCLKENSPLKDKLKAERTAIVNSGTAWSMEEEEILIHRFKSGMNVEELSRIHKRTIGGIKSKLRKLNIIDRYGNIVVKTGVNKLFDEKNNNFTSQATKVDNMIENKTYIQGKNDDIDNKMIIAVCATCGKEVSEKVLRYCRDNSNRFNNKVFCFKHQNNIE